MDKAGTKHIERRLAAILAADVVGYSRLMEANEEGTLDELRRHRREFFEPAVARNGGRIFKVMGDGFLVEFGSVMNAARCAVEIQRGMPQRNDGVPEDRHIKFRIGINVGDIIVDGEDFYGDGVNMAARLEGLAGPGGIACSAAFRDQVGNKLDIEFLDQGEKTVKNISHPVHVYFVNLADVSTAAAVPNGVSSASTTAAAGPFDCKPSVAILPFANMSNDPEQEFFSDGITEDIITDLSKVSGLFVLGRNTVFTYKGKSVNLEVIAKQLGVAYLVEGSVRKAGNRVRINAQLIDGATGGHLWADRYDRDLTDIFAIQDEITTTIVEQLKVTLLPEEQLAIEQVTTQNVEAYTCYLRGRELIRSATKAGLTAGKRMFARAVEIDPQYARAFAGLADCDSILYQIHHAKITVEDILTSADTALALDPMLAEAHAARALAFQVVGRRADAAAAYAQALELDPNCHSAQFRSAQFYLNQGDFRQARPHFIRALELWPDDYQSPFMLQQVCRSLGRTDEAKNYARMGIKRAEAAMQLHPEFSKPAQVGAPALAFLGETDKARDWLAHALKIDPNDNLVRYNAACTYAMLGEIDLAIDLLERHLHEASSDMKLWFLNDSDLDPIRSHPRYETLRELAC